MGLGLREQSQRSKVQGFRGLKGSAVSATSLPSTPSCKKLCGGWGRGEVFFPIPCQLKLEQHNLPV